MNIKKLFSFKKNKEIDNNDDNEHIFKITLYAKASSPEILKDVLVNEIMNKIGCCKIKTYKVEPNIQI